MYESGNGAPPNPMSRLACAAIMKSDAVKTDAMRAAAAHKSTITKGRDGWEAKAMVELDGKRWISVSTYKDHRGIVTSLQGVKVAADSGISFILYGDFNKRISASGVRCTEKTITTHHNAVMSDIESFRALALAFYADKDASDSEQTADQRSADFHDAPGEPDEASEPDYMLRRAI